MRTKNSFKVETKIFLLSTSIQEISEKDFKPKPSLFMLS